MQKPLIILAALALALSACAPAGENPAAVQDEIATAVALTVAAQNEIGTAVALTLAAQSTATSTPTATPTGTALFAPTLTPIIPMVTPIVVTPPPSGSGSGGGSSKPDYDCEVIGRRPFDNSEMAKGDKFDIKWTIVNTGRKAIPDGTDVTHISGPQMSTVSAVELPELKPGEQYTIVMDAFAPTEKGRQVSTWMVQGQLCYPYVAIIVK